MRPGGRLSLGLLVRSLIEDVDVPEELDEFRYSVGTELGYPLNVARDSRVFVGYQVTFESFRTNGSLPPGTSDASFRVHAIGTGVRHELTPTLAINAGLGYSVTVPMHRKMTVIMRLSRVPVSSKPTTSAKRL